MIPQSQGNSAVPVKTTIAARFNCHFNNTVVFKHFDTNPALSAGVLEAALYKGTPAKFLPTPWPPMDGPALSINELCLTKMKWGVAIGNPEATLTAAEIRQRTSTRFPSVFSESTEALAIYDTYVILSVDGDITRHWSVKQKGKYPLFLATQSLGGTEWREFIQAMTILAIAEALESGAFKA